MNYQQNYVPECEFGLAARQQGKAFLFVWRPSKKEVSSNGRCRLLGVRRLGEIGASLKEMSDDINNMSCNQENNRGKTAKASKKAKKKQNLFDQAMVDDEEKISPGQNRLLLRVMSEQIEAKIDSKVALLENNINKKIDKLEDKMDLILSLLGATNQKLE